MTENLKQQNTKKAHRTISSCIHDFVLRLGPPQSSILCCIKSNDLNRISETEKDTDVNKQLIKENRISRLGALIYIYDVPRCEKKAAYSPIWRRLLEDKLFNIQNNQNFLIEWIILRWLFLADLTNIDICLGRFIFSLCSTADHHVPSTNLLCS